MNRMYTAVGAGELLWDIFPDARKWGGACGNFARHCASLGCEAWIVSAVGDDEDGKSIVAESRSYGLNTILPVTDFPTGTVNVKLDEQGIPDFTITENVAWDNVPFTEEMRQLAARADAICFGSLAQRSQTTRQTIAQFLDHAKAGCLKVFDINLRQHYYTRELIEASMKRADILKLNDDELPVVASYLETNADQVEVARALIERYSLQWVVITRGEKGSAMVSKDRIVQCYGFPVRVADTVGAGDAFTAAVAVGILNGVDPEKINETACRIASFVCSQSGAAPQLPDELAGALISRKEDSSW